MPKSKKSKRLGAEHRLWLAILEKTEKYQSKTDAQVREELEAGKFPERIIAEFLKTRPRALEHREDEKP